MADGDNVIGRTERGFGDFARWDTQWHGKVRVRESSVASKGACVWVFCDLAYSNTPKENPPHLHLSYKDAVQLRNALNRFLGAVHEGETTEGKDPAPDEDES